jgi:hypothetical protein
VIAKTFSCNVCSLILLQFVGSQSNNAHGIGESVINCNTTRPLMSCVCSALFFFPLPGILESGVREQILLDGLSAKRRGTKQQSDASRTTHINRI